MYTTIEKLSGKRIRETKERKEEEIIITSLTILYFIKPKEISQNYFWKLSLFNYPFKLALNNNNCD